MRPAFVYYITQTRTADRHRPARRDAPAQAASRARQTRTRPREHRLRALPALWRVLNARGGSTP